MYLESFFLWIIGKIDRSTTISMDNIKIYMSRPTLFDIPDDVQIRFNDSDIVTGGRGYNAWWSKEYERREADDL
jgi:hypothetical protein